MQSLRDILNDLNMYFLYTCCVLKSTPRKVSIVTCNCAGLATIKQSNLDTYNQYKKILKVAIRQCKDTILIRQAKITRQLSSRESSKHFDTIKSDKKQQAAREKISRYGKLNYSCNIYLIITCFISKCNHYTPMLSSCAVFTNLSQEDNIGVLPSH